MIATRGSRRPARIALAALAALAALGLVSCLPAADTGFVEIKTVPSDSTMMFYLDSTQLEPIHHGDAILRQPVGTRKLESEGSDGNLRLLCEIVVAKNRITTVTVSTLEEPPRCACKDSVGAPARSVRRCIG